MLHERVFLDTRWYWTSYAYRDEETAELAWLQLAKVGKRHRGGLEVGFYRHGSSMSGMILVTTLGLKRHGVQMADKVLGAQAYSGFEDEPNEATIEALIARRVRAVHHMSKNDFAQGSYELRREKGETILPDGTFPSGDDWQ
jgi:hypothetical protein